jgi:hypothetical protein
MSSSSVSNWFFGNLDGTPGLMARHPVLFVTTFSAFACALTILANKDTLKTLPKRIKNAVSKIHCSDIENCIPIVIAVSIGFAGIAFFFKIFPLPFNFLKNKISTLIENPKPYQVYTGYSLMAAAHVGMGVRAARQRKVAQTTKHVFASFLTCATLITMAVKIYEARWHHMSYADLAMIPSLPALNLFGAYMAIDSIFYWMKPSRDNYDMSNIFQKYLGVFITQLLILSLIEIVNRFTPEETTLDIQELDHLSNEQIVANTEDPASLV